MSVEDRGPAVPGPTLVPGCYDRLGLMLAARCGISQVYVTPFGVAAARLGASSSQDEAWPHYLAHVRELAEVGVPLVVDGHCGPEGDRDPLGVASALIDVGGSAIVVEDRSRFWEEAEASLMSPTSMTQLLSSLRDRVGGEVTLIARTDALRTAGPDEVVSRCLSFISAGADLVMPLMTPLMSIPDRDADRRKRLALLSRVSAGIGPGRLVVHSPMGQHLSLREAAGVGAGMYLLPQYLLAPRVGLETSMLAALAQRQLESHDHLPQGPIPSPSSVAESAGVERWLEKRW